MVAELLAMDGHLSARRLWPAATDGDPSGMVGLDLAVGGAFIAR